MLLPVGLLLWYMGRLLRRSVRRSGIRPAFSGVSLSTLERMTVECISQPFRLGICSIALAAYSFSETEAGQRDQNLVGVQAGVPAAQVVRFQRLDRLDSMRRDKINFLIDTCQLFQCIQECRGRRAQQRGLAGDDRTVRQLDGRRRLCRRSLRT